MSLDLSFLKSITSKTSVKTLQDTLKFVGYPGGVHLTVTTAGVVKEAHPLQTEFLQADESDENDNEDRRVEDNNLKEKEQSARVDFDADYVNMLRGENDRLTTLITLLQSKIDETLPNLKIEVDLSITDYASAYEATIYYSKDWFANSLYSDAGRIDLADYLLNTIRPYCSVNLDFLTMMAEGDADILKYTRVPRDNS